MACGNLAIEKKSQNETIRILGFYFTMEELIHMC